MEIWDSEPLRLVCVQGEDGVVGRIRTEEFYEKIMMSTNEDRIQARLIQCPTPFDILPKHLITLFC